MNQNDTQSNGDPDPHIIDRIVKRVDGDNLIILREHRGVYEADMIIYYDNRKAKVLEVTKPEGEYEALRVEWQPIELVDFWLPENEFMIGDPRIALWKALTDRKVIIVDAVEVENPECPPSFLGISSGWAHTTAHGPHTMRVFNEDLRHCIDVLADLIAEEYNPFEPIRFYRPALASFGISPYTFTGRECPFDLRVIGMAERSIGVEHEGEAIYAPGLKWYLSTMIVPNPERDRDVHVGVDYGAQYDA